MAFGTFDRDVEKINKNVMLRFVIQTSNGSCGDVQRAFSSSDVEKI